MTDAGVFTAPSVGGGSLKLFSSARLQPFYLSWSQDSRRVSVLSQVTGEEALELGVATAGAAGDYRALDRGVTIWSLDGKYIVFTALSAKGEPSLYVARSDGSLAPRFLAEGISRSGPGSSILEP